MRLVLIIIFGLISTYSISQELKTKKKTILNYQEIYTIDKKTKLKQGNYIRINKLTKDTLVKGHYFNDNKVNIWKYFRENNEVFLEYDYENEKTLYVNIDSTKVDSIQIRKENEFILSKVDVSPFYIGSENKIKTIILQNFQLPKSIFKKELSGMSVASFVITKTGETQDIVIESSYNTEINPAILKSIESLNGKWIPAEVDGNKVDSKMYIVYNIKLTRDVKYEPESKLKDKADLLVINLIYFGVDRERKI